MPPRKKQQIVPAEDANAAVVAYVEPTSADAAVARRYSLRLHPPQPHQKLHRHALESIFDFLSFDELRSAMFVSRRWIDAVYSMRGLEKGKHLDSQQQVASALPSRLSRHVSSVDHWFKPGPLSPVQVQQIAVRMPFLRELHFLALSDDDWSGGVRFPSSLRTVHVLFSAGFAESTINAFVAAISLQRSLTDVSLHLVDGLSQQVSFAPLQALPTLRSLSIRPPYDAPMRGSEFVEITDAQAQELRALTQLESLHCAFSERTLLQLLQPPHGSRLQWTSVDGGSCFTDAVTALLPSLPRLNSFHCSHFSPELRSLNFLGQLSVLTSLSFYLCDHGSNERTDTLLQTLPVSLPQVTRLNLSRSRLVMPQLSVLVSRLPQLRLLCLDEISHLDALTILEPVRNTLHTLCIVDCKAPSFAPDALLSLGSFGQLTQLMMSRSMAAPLDPAMLQALTPPSTLIPSLLKFKYVPPTPPAQ